MFKIRGYRSWHAANFLVGRLYIVAIDADWLAYCTLSICWYTLRRVNNHTHILVILTEFFFKKNFGGGASAPLAHLSSPLSFMFSTTTADAMFTAKPCRAACDDGLNQFNESLKCINLYEANRYFADVCC